MFKNYITIAIRNLAKNKLYAAINIFGLAIGLTIFIFGGIMAKYEKSHDTVWNDYERIYYVASLLAPRANIGVSRLETTFTALGPLFKEGIPEVEYMARTVRRDFLVSQEQSHFNEVTWFTDPDLLKIFSFTYLSGDSSALDDPMGVVITRDQAMKLFGTVDVRGETIRIDHQHQFRINAVIENIPQNSHFVSTQITFGEPFHTLLNLKALEEIDGWQGNYYNTSTGQYTYLKLTQPMPLDELTNKVNTIHLAHTPEDQIENFMSGVFARPITAANTGIWDMIGLPIIESIQMLGLLVLIIAIVNYTNLATAQSMGRTREVGMRKALGASRQQLMIQFLTESLTISAISMLLALVFLEIIIPLFNESLGRAITIQYMELLPYLLVSTIFVGFVAGIYPSYLITKTNTIFALKGMSTRGGKGNFIRTLMIGIQFLLSIFMLGMVLTVYFQNQMLRENSNIFPKDDVLVLQRTDKQEIRDREDLFREQLHQNPYVEQVTFAYQVPYAQTNSTTTVSRIDGDVDAGIETNRLWTDDEFIPTFDIKIVAGRNFSRAITNDYQANDEVDSAHVIINELLRQQLGFKSNEEAVNQSFFSMPGGENQSTFRYQIIGVMETQNILGLHNAVKPFFLHWNHYRHRFGAIRLKPDAPASVINEIEDVWRDVIPEYPIEHVSLAGLFEQGYRIFRTMNSVLAGFATIALTLASIGLFGLAAFMARVRTKEIGIRKVLGADVTQLVKMMLWQFSKPVMWAILIALPLAYLASGAYLNFFSSRIDVSLQIPLILIGGVGAVCLSWLVIALHAIRVAKSSPVHALHYE